MNPLKILNYTLSHLTCSYVVTAQNTAIIIHSNPNSIIKNSPGSPDSTSHTFGLIKLLFKCQKDMKREVQKPLHTHLP